MKVSLLKQRLWRLVDGKTGKQLYSVIISILVAFVAVSSVVFVFLLQRWSLAGHGHAQQLKEKTVILLPFWAARPAAWFVFAESKFREKTIISQRR